MSFVLRLSPAEGETKCSSAPSPLPFAAPAAREGAEGAVGLVLAIFDFFRTAGAAAAAVGFFVRASFLWEKDGIVVCFRSFRRFWLCKKIHSFGFSKNDARFWRQKRALFLLAALRWGALYAIFQGLICF